MGEAAAAGDNHLFWRRWVMGFEWIPSTHSGALFPHTTQLNSSGFWLSTHTPPMRLSEHPLALTPYPLMALPLNFTSRLLVMLLSMDQCSNVLMDLGDTNKKKKDHFCPHGLTVLVGNLDVRVKESAKPGRNTLQFAGPLPWIHLSSKL